MKKKIIFSIMPVLVLAFSLLFAACNGGGGGGGSTGILSTPDPDTPAIYTGSGVTLKVAKTAADLNSKAAITPVNGGRYYYTLTFQNNLISSGTVTISVTGVWTFNPATGTVTGSFKATFSSGTLTFTTEVTYNSGSGRQVIINKGGKLTGGSAAGDGAYVFDGTYYGTYMTLEFKAEAAAGSNGLFQEYVKLNGVWTLYVEVTYTITGNRITATVINVGPDLPWNIAPPVGMNWEGTVYSSDGRIIDRMEMDDGMVMERQ